MTRRRRRRAPGAVVRRGPVLAAVAAAVMAAGAGTAAARADGPAPVVGATAPAAEAGRGRTFTSYGYPRSWAHGDPATTRDPRVLSLPLPATVSAAPAAFGFGARAGPPFPTTSVPAAGGPCVAPGRSCARFEAWGGYWRPRVTGDTLITRGGEPGSGTTLDADADLDLGTGDAWFVGAAWRPWPRHRVFLGYEALAFDGSSRLDHDAVFRGATFTAGERVASSLDLTLVEGGYDYGLVQRDDAEVRVGAAAWLWRFEQRVRSLDGGADESRSFSHVLPVAHVVGERSLGVLDVAARAAGGWIGTRRYAIDLSAATGVTLWDRVRLDAGWRWMRFVFDETTNEGDLTFSGPFVGVAVDL